MAETRLYVVRDEITGKGRLVEAASGAQAVRHVAQEQFSVSPAKPGDVVELMMSGVLPEKAGVAGDGD